MQITQDVKRAGSGIIDLYKGSLDFFHSDISYSSGNVPLNIFHVYNPEMETKKQKFNFSGFNTGNGWKLNLQQKLLPNAEHNEIQYLDAQGGEHCFIKTKFNRLRAKVFYSECYFDKNGSDLILWKDANQNYIMVDSSGNKTTFSKNNSYLLTSVVRSDKTTSICKIQYKNDGEIEYFCDGSGRKAQFYYDSNHYLTSIKNNLADRTWELVYEYKDGFLNKIYYLNENGAKVDFSEYSYANSEFTVTDQSGYGITYRYNSAGKVDGYNDFAVNSSISSSSIVKNTVNKIMANRNIEYSGNETTITTENSLKTTCRFSDSGECYLQYENNITSESGKKNLAQYTYKKAGKNYSCKFYFNSSQEITDSSGVSKKVLNLIDSNGFPDDKLIEFINKDKNSSVSFVEPQVYLKCAKGTESKKYYPNNITKIDEINENINGNVYLEDIEYMQKYENTISYGKTFHTSYRSKSPVIYFGNNSYYGIYDIEIIYGGDITATYGKTNASVLRDSDLNVTEQKYSMQSGTNTNEFKTLNTYSDNKLQTSTDFRNLVSENVYANINNSLTDIQNLAYPKNGKTGPDKIINQIRVDIENNILQYDCDTRDNTENFNERIITSYETDTSMDKLTCVYLPDYTNTLPNDNTVKYDYSPHNSNLKSITMCNKGIEHKIEFSYTKNLLTTIKQANNKYELKYDGFCNLETVTLNGTTILSQKFEVNENVDSAKNNYYSSIKNYGNSDSLRIQSDQYGRVVSADAYSPTFKELFANKYDSETGDLENHTDKVSAAINGGRNVEWDFTSTYDAAYVNANDWEAAIGERTEGTKIWLQNTNGTAETRGVYTHKYIQNLVKDITYEINKTTRKTVIDYDMTNGIINPDQRIKTINHETIQSKHAYDYDSLSRIEYRKANKANNSNICTEGYEYLSVGSGENEKTTPYIKKINHSSVSGTNSLSYTYTKGGNIQSVCENGVEQIRYKYDSLNRLIREDNRYFYKTVLYNYDAVGNITYKKEYLFSTDDPINQQSITNPLTVSNDLYVSEGLYLSVNAVELTEKQISYGYTTTGRKDALLSYDGVTLTAAQAVYDNDGNPKTYFKHGVKDNFCSLQWERNKLKQIDFDYTTKYYYDSLGRRSRKSILKPGNTLNSDYFYDGEKLLRENRGNDILWYIHDQTGITGIEYIPNGVTNVNAPSSVYYFQKSLQGDVIYIVDSNGKNVVKYAYDAWGKCKIIYDDSGVGIGTFNPIRYRSYYYDTETDFYYLNARYYDPETCRFINSDDANYALSQCDSISGLNLYSYCLNNPVIYTDSSGCSPWNDFWNGVGNWFSNTGSWINNNVFQPIGNFFSSPSVQESLMMIGSGLLTLGGTACMFFPGLQGFGTFLISTGVASFVGGLTNKSMNGSFFAGWAGGLLTGIFSGIPVAGPLASFLLGFAGGFAGNMTTGLIDGRKISDSGLWGSSLIAGFATGGFNAILSFVKPAFGVSGKSDWYNAAALGYSTYYIMINAFRNWLIGHSGSIF